MSLTKKYLDPADPFKGCFLGFFFQTCKVSDVCMPRGGRKRVLCLLMRSDTMTIVLLQRWKTKIKNSGSMCHPFCVMGNKKVRPNAGGKAAEKHFQVQQKAVLSSQGFSLLPLQLT